MIWKIPYPEFYIPFLWFKKNSGSGRFKRSRIRNFTSRIFDIKDSGSGRFKRSRIRNFTSRIFDLKDSGSRIFQSIFAMKNLDKLKFVNSTTLLTVWYGTVRYRRYGTVRYGTVMYDTVRYLFSLFGTCVLVKYDGTVPFFFIRHVYSCQIWRYHTFFLYSARVFLSNMTVPCLFSLFGTCILVKYDGTVPFFFIRHVYSCQIWRYRKFFLYSARVFLSNMTVPYLFSLFGTCILVITAGTVPFFSILILILRYASCHLRGPMKRCKMKNMELKENGTEQLVSAWCLGQCSGSGIQCLFDPWIRDPGRVKNQNPDPQHWLVVLSDRYDFCKLLNSTVPYIFLLRYGTLSYRTVR